MYIGEGDDGLRECSGRSLLQNCCNSGCRGVCPAVEGVVDVRWCHHHALMYGGVTPRIVMYDCVRHHVVMYGGVTPLLNVW